MLIQIDWMWNWNKTGVWHGAGWVLLSNCHLMQHGPQLELDNFLMCGTMWLSNVSNELAMLLQCLQDLPRSWMQTLEAIAAPPHWVWEEVWDNENVWELQWVGCQLVRGPRRIWADYVTPCHSAITAPQVEQLDPETMSNNFRLWLTSMPAKSFPVQVGWWSCMIMRDAWDFPSGSSALDESQMPLRSVVAGTDLKSTWIDTDTRYISYTFIHL